MENNLLEFDLEKALNGATLVTRDGREVTDFHYFKSDESDMPIVAVVDGQRCSYTTQGSYFSSMRDNLDLFIKAKDRTVCVNVFDDGRICLSGDGLNTLPNQIPHKGLHSVFTITVPDLR